MTGSKIVEVVYRSNRHEQIIDRDPGTYALVLASSTQLKIRIGKRGVLSVEPGYYVYVGSAAGPGGVGARVERHARRKKRIHWHIDYLAKVVAVDRVWHSIETGDAEHRWATAVGAMNGATVPLARFGSSDCRCVSHLFHFSSRPSVEEFEGKLR